MLDGKTMMMKTVLIFLLDTNTVLLNNTMSLTKHRIHKNGAETITKNTTIIQLYSKNL